MLENKKYDRAQKEISHQKCPPIRSRQEESQKIGTQKTNHVMISVYYSKIKKKLRQGAQVKYISHTTRYEQHQKKIKTAEEQMSARTYITTSNR